MKTQAQIFFVFVLSFCLSSCGDNHSSQSLSSSAQLPPPVLNGIVTFSGPRNNYSILRTTTSVVVTDLLGSEGSSNVSNANKLIFKDMSINLNVASLAKSIPDSQLQSLIELYIAFFNRVPDADGMAYWITQLHNGQSLSQVADSFYNAGLQFPSMTGYSPQMSNLDFVKIIYKNVLGRTGSTAPGDAELAYWVGELESKRQTKSSLVSTMLGTARTLANDPAVGWVTSLLNNKISAGRYIALDQGITYLDTNEVIAKSIAIASAVTSTDTSNALKLIGIVDQNFSLLATVPDQPNNLIVSMSNGSASISFNAPAMTGGLPILTYVASCSSGANSQSLNTTASPVIFNNLLSNTTYNCVISASNAYGTGVPSASISVTPSSSSTLGNFNGNIVLGTPSDNSIKANIFSPTQNGVISLSYGTVSGKYSKRTDNFVLSAAKPLEISLSGLSPDMRYYYRLEFQSNDGIGSGPTEEYSFQTARSPGQSFVFALQGDSHPEREKTQFDGGLYTRTLQTAAADHPDFYLTLGDDFSVDTLDPATINADKVKERYTIQRPYLGIIGKSAPVFLVNGNHEQAARFNLNGTPDNIAVWAQNARNSHYSQPATDGFYSGNKENTPFIGLLRNYFSWTWGDALFVVIDPYWESPVAVDNVFGGAAKRTNMWDVTHGNEQYAWLKSTLENSKAKYKFIFAHHVMGTGRGGIELADFWEWGGKNAKGVSEFATQRPTWNIPIHQLMVANKVTIFFQGHDHIWVKQQLDGVIYQSLSEPADPNYALWNSDAYLTGDRFPSTGYTRVSVSPNGVKVEYVRTYLPKDEGPGKINGSAVFSYSIP